MLIDAYLCICLNPGMENLIIENTQNPKELMKSIKEILASVKDLCRSNLSALNDPIAKALLETSADVLEGLVKTYEHYHEGGDNWKTDYMSYEEGPQKSSDPWD